MTAGGPFDRFRAFGGALGQSPAATAAPPRGGVAVPPRQARGLRQGTGGRAPPLWKARGGRVLPRGHRRAEPSGSDRNDRHDTARHDGRATHRSSRLPCGGVAVPPRQARGLRQGTGGRAPPLWKARGGRALPRGHRRRSRRAPIGTTGTTERQHIDGSGDGRRALDDKRRWAGRRGRGPRAGITRLRRRGG
jgi:hypothetical protein